MSSTGEEVNPANTKPKSSPLDFRNTELVSRLLAATPPYLYNMPLVPHTYFFSEMLRSLVQGKTEAAAGRATPVAPPRRARKRSWSQPRQDHFPPRRNSPPTRPDPADMPPPTWTPAKPPPQVTHSPHQASLLERPLELTTHKPPEPIAGNHPPPPTQIPPQEKDLSSGQIPMMFPATLTQDTPTTHPDLILPPPPPIWYPPLYPAPYGIDPLHFFIDLRVSGHIYDRKTPKDPLPPPGTLPHEASSTLQESSYPFMKQPRHPSAFSVPNATLTRHDALNLSGNNKYPLAEEKPAKFDIKSMGFDTNENGRSANYVLKNLSRIYKDVQGAKSKEETVDLSTPKSESENLNEPQPQSEVVQVKDEESGEGTTSGDKEDCKEEDDEEKEKRCKDLRALIGLELVVDYVKHEVKPGTKCSPTEGANNSEIGSPPVHVVDAPNAI